jgi:hypothetical protein
MRSTFVGQPINFMGPATLVVGKKKIAGEALMCGTLYVEVGATAGFVTASSHAGFRPSDVNGSFRVGEATALSAIKAGAAEIVWKNRGKETTLPILVTEVRMSSIKFVAHESKDRG